MKIPIELFEIILQNFEYFNACRFRLVSRSLRDFINKQFHPRCIDFASSVFRDACFKEATALICAENFVKKINSFIDARLSKNPSFFSQVQYLIINFCQNEKLTGNISIIVLKKLLHACCTIVSPDSSSPTTTHTPLQTIVPHQEDKANDPLEHGTDIFISL